MNISEQTEQGSAHRPEGRRSRIIQRLSRAIDLASRQSDACAEQGQWALSARWGEISARLTAVVADLAGGADESPARQDSLAADTVYQLLRGAESMTHDMTPGTDAEIPSRATVAILDLTREVRDLGS